MRLLFLDFDGVLHPSDVHPEHLDFCWLPDLEELLQLHPDVHIVVHSSWRYDHLDHELRAHLGSLGGRFVGSAPRGPREQAVEMVLQANQARVTSHIVLDDTASEFTSGRLNVMILDGATGISNEKAKYVIAKWLEASKAE